MADWKAGGHLEHHFRLHGHEVGARTIAEYDASAQETLRLGVIFSYWDRIAQERRVAPITRPRAASSRPTRMT